MILINITISITIEITTAITITIGITVTTTITIPICQGSQGPEASFFMTPHTRACPIGSST